MNREAKGVEVRTMMIRNTSLVRSINLILLPSTILVKVFNFDFDFDCVIVENFHSLVDLAFSSGYSPRVTNIAQMITNSPARFLHKLIRRISLLIVMDSN